MSPSLIGIIITALIGTILVFSFLLGMKRGWKKSLFRFAWLLLTLVAVFFLTPPMAKWINGFDISSLGLNIYGEVKEFRDIGLNLFNEIAKSEAAISNSQALKSFAENLPAMILNILLFVVLFWVLKLILYPFWTWFSSMIFDKQSREIKKYKKQQAKLKKQNKGVQPPQDDTMPILLQVNKNKSRFGGAMIGLVTGLMLCCIFFSPLVGLNAIYQNVLANVITEKDGEKVSLIESSIEDKETLELLSSYENSIGSKILTYTGIGFLSNTIFNGLATVNVQNEKVYLSDELNMAIKVYNKYDSIKNFNFNDMTQESLSKFLTAVKDIFFDIRDSKILYLLGDDLLPYVLDDLMDAPDFTLIDGGQLDDIVVSAYRAYSSNFKLADVKNQLEALVDIAAQLNKENLVVPMARGEISSLEEIVNHIATNVKTPYELASTIAENLYRINMLKSKYPELLDMGIKEVFNALEIDYTSQTLDSNTLKQPLKEIIYNMLEVVRYYNNNKDLDFGNKTRTVLKSVGTVLDNLQIYFLTEENYNSLLEYGIEEINNATGSFADFSNIIENLKTIQYEAPVDGGTVNTGWEYELYSLTALYEAVIKVVNDNISFESILEEDYVAFDQIGEGIDSALRGHSKIISNEVIREGLEIILNTIDTTNFNEVLSVEISDGVTFKDTILNNIYNKATQTSSITKWSDEIKYNRRVLSSAYKIVTDNFNLDVLSAEDDEQLEKLGKAIDDAILKTKLVLSNEVIRGVAEYYLDTVEFGEEVDKIFAINYGKNASMEDITVYDKMLDNIYDKEAPSSSSNLSWEYELSKIKNVLTAEFNTTELVALGAILDDILGSRVISKDVINKIVAKYIDDETVSLPMGLNDGMTAMKDNLGNVVSYELEFGFILELIDCLEATYGTNQEKYEAIGSKFNKVSNSMGTETTYSKLFLKPVLNKYLVYYFDDYTNKLEGEVSEEIINIVDSIKSNLLDISDYRREFINILNLVDVVDATDLTEVGIVLDNITSNIITPSIIRNLIAHYFKEEVKTLEEGTLKDLLLKVNREDVASVYDNIKNVYLVPHSYYQEFDYIQKLSDVLLANELDYEDLGVALDAVCNTAENASAPASVFVTRKIVEEVLKYYFDDFATKNLTAKEDEDLLVVVEDIKTKITLIRNFETELGYINQIFNAVENYDSTTVGEIFDSINGNSNLITPQSINAIVLHYFDKESSSYATNSEYATVIGLMREKAELATNYTVLFSELDKIVDNIAEFETITSVEDFMALSDNAVENFGAKLDEMESFTQVCDKSITYEVAKIILGKISSTTVASAKIEAVKESEIFKFSTYNTDNFTGTYGTETYPGTTYYTHLFEAIKLAFGA